MSAIKLSAAKKSVSIAGPVFVARIGLQGAGAGAQFGRSPAEAAFPRRVAGPLSGRGFLGLLADPSALAMATSILVDGEVDGVPGQIPPCERNRKPIFILGGSRGG